MPIKDVCAKCFSSLSVGSRMKIYNFLSKNNGSGVSQIVDIVKLSQPTISYHLKSMEKVGLLKSQKRGKEVLYFVDTACSDCFLKHA